MNEINLKIGDKYYYISVPKNCNWIDIKVNGPCTYKGTENLEDYIYSTNPATFDELLSTLKENITKKFKELNKGWKPTAKTKQFWVTLNYSPWLKTIHSKSEKAQENTDYNYFKSTKDAEEMKNCIILTFASFDIHLL